MSRVKTGYTPGPTDRVHVGNLKTALYAYLITKHGGGDFLFRIEDTDQERFVEGAVETIYQTLEDTGLIHDGGPDKDGGRGPHVQGERQASGIYLEHAKEPVGRGEAYYCLCIPECLTTLKTIVNGEEIMAYDKHCFHLTKEEAETNLIVDMPYVTRQSNPTTGITALRDEIYGDIAADNPELDDMVLIKSDEYPIYNFANVVGGHLTGITHAVRGNEYLSLSPRHNRLYIAFRWGVPIYVCCPLITDESHHKLSKRSGHSSFEDLLEQDLTFQAVVNYMALLDQSPKNNREISTLEEMIKESDHRRMSESPAVFDITKLKWMNGEYMKAMSSDTFYEVAEPYLKATVSGNLDLKKIAPMIKTRTEIFSDVADHVNFSEILPEYDTATYTHKKMRTNPGTSLKVLKDALLLLEAQGDLTDDALYGALPRYVEGTGVKTGFVMWPIRTIVSGKQMTPTEATEITEVLNKEEPLARIRRGIQILEA